MTVDAGFLLDAVSPHGCGLWKVDDNGNIRVVKKAIVSKTPEPLPQSVIQRIAYRASRLATITTGGQA